MTYNYISYIAILLSIIINSIFYFKKNNLGNNNTPNNILLSNYIKIANYLIIANVIITIIGIFLKQNKILITKFDDFLIIMFINITLIITSSIIGIIACIYSLYMIKKSNPELMSNAPQKAKMRFFSQFAIFVFGITWAITDSIITFDWVDYFTRLMLFEPLQYIPIEGIVYISLLFIIANMKLFDIWKINLSIRKKRS